MTHVCSVILIRRSFDIYHEQQKISLHNESILLLEKNLADDFAFCYLSFFFDLCRSWGSCQGPEGVHSGAVSRMIRMFQGIQVPNFKKNDLSIEMS